MQVARPPSEWVSLLEGWRILGRHLSGNADDLFSDEVAKKAAGLLSAAAREGRLKSEGWRDGGTRLERLTPADWQKRRPNFARNALFELTPWRRKIPHPDRICDVVVDAQDVRRLLVPELSSDVTNEGDKPPSRRRGRTPTYDWGVARALIEDRIRRDGWPLDPENGEGWRSLSDVETYIAESFSEKGWDPVESTIRDNVSKILDDLWPGKADK